MQPRWPQRHSGPLGVDRDVPDLAGGAARAAPQLAVRDDSGGDAGAEVEDSPSSPEPPCSA